MRIRALMALAGAAAFAVAACGQNDSAEQQGEEFDNQIEETFQGEVDPGDGPMERIGETIDEATGEENTDPVDAMSDATDGEASTDAPSPDEN